MITSIICVLVGACFLALVISRLEASSGYACDSSMVPAVLFMAFVIIAIILLIGWLVGVWGFVMY